MPTANARSGASKLWHDESVLRKLYEQDGKTQKEIASELGCSMLTINKAFKKFGIKAKRGRRPAKTKRVVTRVAAPYTRIAASGLRPEQVRARFIELTEIMEKLGPNARQAVKKDLHDLIDRL
jgi:transcriptional regulator with XRE-family HTH domain